jgi:hypothetical protein
MSTEYVNPPAGGYPEIIDVAVDGEAKKIPVGPPFVELGGTGLKRSTGVIDEEFLPALRGTKGVKVFTEMSQNDATIGALLFTIEKLLREVTWTVVGDDSSPEQAKAVQFVEECIDDMSHSFDDLVAEILSMLPYGWSWHEIVYKKRIGPWENDGRRRSKFTDGKIGWRKMPIRAQETLHRWLFDDTGGIKGMVQIPAPTYTQRTLSIERCLLFRTGAHKGNPEGRSILRNAYRPWFFKKRLEEFEAIGVERDLAGLPFAKVPSQIMKPDATPQQKQLFTAFKRLVSNVRRDEHDGVVIPSDVDPDTKTPEYDFQLLSSGGGKTFDTNALIERYSTEILMTVLADFIKVGHQGTGSYALHVDKTGIFRAALNSIAQGIADVFNRHAIPRLFAMNQWKLDKLPRIEPSNVDPPNLAELGAFMQTMAGLGMTFFPDPDLEKFLREASHLPDLPQEVEEMRREEADMQNAMAFEGAKQKQQMVAEGMTPEQAEMQAQAPTPEMQEQEQAGAMQQQEMDAQGKQMDMDIKGRDAELKMQGQKQGLEIDGKSKRQALEHDRRAKDLEHRHNKRSKDLEYTHKKRISELSIREKKEAMKQRPKANEPKKTFPKKKK